MSEGDVSLIRDEDLLRRMWQQTEDFSRKKEIRAHMYKLREERLRNLYSPEPPNKDGKGCEFTSAQGHVKSFADQTFQSMKSKEVRDAGSPPKEFTYRGQDLKELSNAGWNVESENRTTDDGHTHVKSVQANIEGHYDVDGGRGQFAARDQHTQAVTEYQDHNTSLKRNESSSNTSAREQVVRQTDDGTHSSSTTSSSISSSKVEQVSSTKHETVPYITNEDYDRKTNDTYQNKQSITRKEVTNDYEQSLRRNDLDQAELVSRKVDYPDDNTKVIVETRLLPDGTRVTSTRREFRAPVVHNSRSEQYSQQMRSESKSYKTSSQHTSDREEYTSKVTNDNIQNQCTNIVDSQKTADDYDFKRNQQIHSVHKDETFDSRQQKIDRNQYTVNKEDIDKRKIHSENIEQKGETQHNMEERVYETKQQNNTERIVEKKTISDQYQTTYNTDYTQKKISNDWSPSQQAWASSLRADTPSSTGPTTRASSPGSRTYQSSTSSLRSSVSPDKVSRKPPSRGGSPNKAEKQSPTRTSSDKYFSSYTSNSMTETKTTRHTSPEGKPPHGKSPTRPSYSPEKTPRKSVSPEKTSHEPLQRKTPNRNISPVHNACEQGNLRMKSPSPERKNAYNNVPKESDHRSTSPSKLRNINQNVPKVRDSPDEADASLPTELPYRSRLSPEKKPSGSPTRESSPAKSIRGKTPLIERNPNSSFPRDISPEKNHPRSNIQHRSSPSPERKSYHEPNEETSDLYLPKNPNQASPSPDRKPNYMRPTAASQTPKSDISKSVPKKTASPDRKYSSTNIDQNEKVDKLKTVKSDHYTFIDEETKMYTRTDKRNEEKHSNINDVHERKPSKSPSPTRHSPSVDMPDYCKRESTPRPTLRKNSRSPSPPKGPVTFTQDHTSDTMEVIRTDITSSTNDKKEFISPCTPKKDSPQYEEPLPSKYSTYDKKQTSEIKYDSSTRREQSARRSQELPSSPMKKSPRQSVSPSKPTKDTKFGTTSDFITTEKTTEELNKKVVSKDRPRQLITPSTSPTRKLKVTDTPSSGQSSPTTSVSGFVYFSSPRAEETIVTDLDEQESYSETIDLAETSIMDTRPKSLNIKRSPSPSKIPCRSPSPEKHISPTTEILPRKSSLKKPSIVNQVSPTEKPPSSFRVSPTTENQDHLDNITFSKDSPAKNHGKINKTKPPLERRETYEERCRKILGMMDDDKNKTITKKNKEFTSSPTVSPSYSPNKTEDFSFDYRNQKTTQSHTDEFITREKEQSIDQRSKSPKPTAKVSRDSSPTKLQDIISTNHYDTSNTTIKTTVNDKTKLISTRENEEKSLPSGNATQSSFSPETTLNKKLPRGESIDKKPEQPENNRRTSNKSPAKFQPKKSVSPNRKPTTHNSGMSDEKLSTEKHTVNVKTASVIRQETYDVDESQLLSNSTLPREPKCTSPPRDHQKPIDRRTPSPDKIKTSVIDTTEELIVSQREKEILDRVQQSLRKLSPNRNEKLPSRGKSPPKSTTSLQNAEILISEHVETSDFGKESKKIIESITDIEKTHSDQAKQTKSKGPINEKTDNKPPSRNSSPAKKSTTSGPVKNPEPLNKSRSISPKKTVASVERPQSPQIQKNSGIKPKEPVPTLPTRKSTSPTKAEKVFVTTDVKKNISKQSSFTKTSSKTSNKINHSSPSKTNEPDSKRAIPKNQNISRKEADLKVTRTASDTSIKTKKSTPQRMKSKSEIPTNEELTRGTSKQTISINRLTKPTITVSQSQLPSKPKSATALNTSTDEDDIIIDVLQAKSSRENSPDRICPTPVNFTDDVGTPRYPDEVNEPDDEFRQRTYNTIHEVESIVDDIVEICEDDELFVKHNDSKVVSETDECLLSVNDKVSKFTNKIDSMSKTKDTTKYFKDTEKRVHSDFINENLQSDECLLTVSEKVNKFAKGPRDRKDSKSPSRQIVDEYDKNTTYQDDYTKLSVNDKAHLFSDTAENIKAPKVKPTIKVERPDMTDVDESLKSDDCLLSVSDKVNKFVKTAEQFLSHSQEIEEKEKKIKEQHDFIMKKIVENVDINIKSSDLNQTTEENVDKTEETDHLNRKTFDDVTEKKNSFTKETASSHAKAKNVPSQNLKANEKTPTIKITTLRSSEAVKKAKALFENIASTQKTTNKDSTNIKTTKLTDIGVIKKSPKTDSTIVLHPSLEDGSPNITDVDSEVDTTSVKPDFQSSSISSRTPVRTHQQPSHISDEKPRSTPSRLTPHSPGFTRTKSPNRQSLETSTISKTDNTQQSVQRAESPYLIRNEREGTLQDKMPGYQRPTKTSQLKEEIKTVEETEVSSRRGSGKFGVELRRTSVERSTISSERRRSVEHHQPCIEDIFDLDLLEQMLEKVVGYEQRRRIRAQIRVAKKRNETDKDNNTKITKHTTTLTISKSKSPDRRPTKSPERQPKFDSQKTISPETQAKSTTQKCVQDSSYSKEQTITVNGHSKESVKLERYPHQRPRSPEKLAPKSPTASKSPVRHPSSDKKPRTTSPNKTTSTKPKPNRFNEYASAYLKKAGINENDKVKVLETKMNKSTEAGDRKIVSHVEEHKITETKSMISKSSIEKTSSKDIIEVNRVNGKRTPSPEKKRSPERKVETPTERLREKSPSPVLKRQLSDSGKKETIVKTVYAIDKKLQPKQVQEEKPSWVTNRNLKKITSETRSFSSKKIESEKPKYRAPSPSKVIAKPLDVITSSYGPGPLDADGKPLFGIKALRNGATNYQVKGTVIRQEFHSRNGGEPEGSVSVTAYSNSPEELQRLLRTQGERPSRLHGLAAITTTKKFGGTTGNTYKDIHTKEERAALDQFTHSDRRVLDSRVEISDITSSDTKEERIQEIDYQDTVTSQQKQEKREEIKERKGVKQEKRERMRQSEERKERTEKIERSERREDKKTVRQSSVKSLTEKFIKNASEVPKTTSTYPKAGLILRTATMKDSVSSDSSAHAGLARTDSEHSLGSMEDVMVTSSTDRTTTQTDRSGRTTTQTDRMGHTTTKTDRTGRITTKTERTPIDRAGRTVVTTTTTTTRSREPASFLDNSTKVTGVQDILTRMKNADIVIQEGDSSEDSEARALLNKFLGATVLMAGMRGYVAGQQQPQQETVRSSSVQVTSSVEEIDLDQCWDERILRKLLDECTDTEQRRRLRARIRSLMAEQEASPVAACATAVTEALAAAGAETGDGDAREEEEVTTVTSSVRRNSSEKTISSSTTTKTTKVIENMTRPAPKTVSPFAKFRQLEKQNSINSPNSPKTPQSPGSPSQPLFKFTDPVVQASALTIKERLLQWCRDKTRDYENVKLENFSTSWADGLAFCALLHHFLPDAFDYSKLTPEKRRHNFTLAFKVADEKAGIYPLLDVDDMVAMRKPDWKCVFTYVQSIHRRFKDQN